MLLFPGLGFKIKKQLDFTEIQNICAITCLNLVIAHILTDLSTFRFFFVTIWEKDLHIGSPKHVFLILVLALINK